MIEISTKKSCHIYRAVLAISYFIILYYCAGLHEESLNIIYRINYNELMVLKT